ncbi:unnamed protein product, partial [Prunus brigantina]
PLCIQYPRVAAGKTDVFELKSSLLHHIPRYHGLSMEDPNKHLKEFEVVCSSMTPINVDGNILKMKAFPFSLMDKAKDWLYELAPGTRQMLDASAGGALVDKTPVAAKILIANRALNAQQYEGNQAKEMSEVKKQIGQMAEFMGQFREEGKLPSSTIVNPKGGFETAKAIILRSGKEIGTNPKMSKQSPTENEKLLFKEKEEDKATAREEKPLPQFPKAPTQPNLGKVVPNSTHSNHIPPNVPFPRRFMQSKKEENEKDILETFRKVQVNIPLLDAIKQVPKYAKFLKELCTTRRRNSNKEVVRVSENVSAVLQRKLPPKCKDPADRSNAYPKGVLEDVLVQVNHLIFPADFYVLEMEDSAHSTPLPILLGRPFMKTARTKIDVFKGTLTMEFDGDIIDFNISEAIRYPIDDHSCFSIDAFD